MPSPHINNVADMINIFKHYSKGRVASTGYYLRGQSDKSWGIIPTIAQSREYAGEKINGFPPMSERDLFHRFRRGIHNHLMRKSGKWETLFLARHHGLPVRLLDWTANPLVALYFACDEEYNKDKDGVVFIIQRKASAQFIDIYKTRHTPFSIKGVKFIHPFCPTSRMTAQSSVFTIHSPHYWSDLISILKKKDKRCDIKNIKPYKIKKENKGRILKELQRLGVNASTLFPEYDGLAEGLWHTEVMRIGR